MVDRPIDEVWAFLTDLFNAPRLWGRRLLGLRQTSPGSAGVGSTFQGRMVIYGFETRVTLVVTEWDPPHAVAFSGILRPFGPTVARWALEPASDGTKMTRSADFELRGPLKFVWPLLTPLMGGGMRDASRNLKQFIEAQPRSE